MTPKTLMSVEDFMALPSDGMHHELNEGELVVKPPPKARHGKCQVKLASALDQFADAHEMGTVYTETGYRLTARTIRAPDVSFVGKARLQHQDDYFEGCPDLAVEIVSPDESAADLLEKTKQYLAAGTSRVWIVYPKAGQVHIYTPSSTVRILGLNDTLEAPDLLPGFQLSVRAILQ